MKKEDLHVHLHGCLTPEDLWQFGKDSYKKKIPLLDWYSSEYEKAWGRRPSYLDYWEKENGLELLRKDYLFLEPNNFDRFQACFNLIIALCPLKTDDFSVQEHIIRKKEKEGLNYFEARVVFAPRFDSAMAYDYLKNHCSSVKALNKELSMKTKLVFSLPREESLLEKQYLWIKEFCLKEKGLSKEIAGIDFAFLEEGYPPEKKRSFFKSFFLDNEKRKALKAFYHVGESFRDKSLFSAVRWVVEAHHLGSDRLGHAIALGVEPSLYKGKTVLESSSELEKTITWLQKNSSLLKAYGYEVNLKKIKEDFFSEAKNSFNSFTYKEEIIADLRNFQTACQKILKEEEVIIESCPTSNLRIGEIPSLSYHPLRSFLKNNLSVVLGTDDPGIFETNFEQELALYNSLSSESS